MFGTAIVLGSVAADRPSNDLLVYAAQFYVRLEQLSLASDYSADADQVHVAHRPGEHDRPARISNAVWVADGRHISIHPGCRTAVLHPPARFYFRGGRRSGKGMNLEKPCLFEKVCCSLPPYCH